MRGRHLAAAIVVVAGFAGCGADDESALRQTSDKLSEVRSGTLSLRFVIASQSSARDSDVGFDIHGRFSRAARTGELPQIDLAYTQIAGARRETARVGSDGRRAWIRIGGRAYTLPPQRTRRLRSGAGGDGGAGLDALALDRWFADPKSSDGGEVDGVTRHASPAAHGSRPPCRSSWPWVGAPGPAAVRCASTTTRAASSRRRRRTPRSRCTRARTTTSCAGLSSAPASR